MRASRALRVDQTTVGRRIARLEEDLGVEVFRKTREGFLLSPDGQRLLPYAEQMEKAALELERVSSASHEKVAGKVVLTSTELFINQVIAPHLPYCLDRFPEIQLQVRTGEEILDLSKGEADVAIRMGELDNSNLIANKVGEIAFAPYGSAEYLERHGTPQTKGELARHRWIGCFGDFDGKGAVDYTKKIGSGLKPAVLVSSRLTSATLIRSGAGLGVLPISLGDAQLDLRRLPIGEVGRVPAWIVMAPGFKDTPRIRVLVEFLGELIRGKSDQLRGRG